MTPQLIIVVLLAILVIGSTFILALSLCKMAARTDEYLDRIEKELHERS